MNTKFEPIIQALSGIAGRVVASSNRHQFERRVARYSAYQLQDIGYARDWDGSIYRPKDLH